MVYQFDSAGNVYAAGAINSGNYAFGSGAALQVYYNAGGMNAVLVKYDFSGRALWARTVSTCVTSSWYFSTAVNTGGNIYAAGSIYGVGTYTLGTGVTADGITVGGLSVVLVKYLK